MSAEWALQKRALLITLAFVGNVIPVGIACAADWSTHRTVFFLGAIGVCLVPLLVTALPIRWRVIRRVVGLFGLIPLTAMQAYTGGAASPDALLMMMAMVWFGIQAETVDLLLMIGTLCGCAVLPMIVIGPPAYPVEWAHAALLVVIGVSVAGSLRLAVLETVRLTDRLREAAATDPLTGLLNRRGWQTMTGTVLAQARRQSRPVCAAAFDLDAFKQLNDQLGHDEGDRLLVETAERLRSVFRAGDLVARSGGDEFVALLVDTPGDAALTAIGRLTGASSRPRSMSAGVAVWDPSEPLADLMRRADLALYEAKRAGGGGVALAPAPFAEGRARLAGPIVPDARADPRDLAAGAVDV